MSTRSGCNRRVMNGPPHHSRTTASSWGWSGASASWARPGTSRSRRSASARRSKGAPGCGTAWLNRMGANGSTVMDRDRVEPSGRGSGQPTSSPARRTPMADWRHRPSPAALPCHLDRTRCASNATRSLMRWQTPRCLSPHSGHLCRVSSRGSRRPTAQRPRPHRGSTRGPRRRTPRPPPASAAADCGAGSRRERCRAGRHAAPGSPSAAR